MSPPFGHHALRSQFGSTRWLAAIRKVIIIRREKARENSTRHSNNSLQKQRKQERPKKTLTLHESAQHTAPRLQKRMSNNNLQEALQAPPPLFDHAVVKAVEVDFTRQRRNRNTRALTLEQVPEDFEVGVAATNFGAAQLESGNVGREAD